MKKLLNDVRQAVPDMLQGLVAITPGLALLADETVVVRTGGLANQVALISGGGAGHEPAHAGYVGPGLLHAAVVGAVFTSPSPDAVLAALRAVTGPAGALLIVKNYTGDRLNFGLAAELARAEGLAVEMVIVDDDVALTDPGAGRRGLAGTVLIHKLAGAAAAGGQTLAEVTEVARSAVAQLGTMGVALGACIVPAAGIAGFSLGEQEIELGLGIHGEAGVRRAAMAPAAVLVATLLDTIIADRGLLPGARVALLVNGLGGTPSMELGVVTRDAVAALAAQGMHVERAWTGVFLTALEMPGVSLSLLVVDDARLALLDAPAQAPAWPGPGHPARLDRPLVPGRRVAPAAPVAQRDARVDAGVRAVCAALIAAEPELTRLDQISGDGDLGASMARGAEAMLRDLPTYPTTDPAGTARALSATLRRALGGSSGPFYAVMLLRAAEVLAGGGTVAAALAAGAQGIATLGGAQAGDRTMLDALLPAAVALQSGTIADAARAGDAGTAATASMVPRRGRATYLANRVVGHVDPGARAVAIWLNALARA